MQPIVYIQQQKLAGPKQSGCSMYEVLRSYVYIMQLWLGLRIAEMLGIKTHKAYRSASVKAFV